ncbi:hypothetical protein GS943_18180 [Rhodococcus hoagii]|nr:hypothetical protein [Prescottella equi]
MTARGGADAVAVSTADGEPELDGASGQHRWPPNQRRLSRWHAGPEVRGVGTIRMPGTVPEKQALSST